MRKSVDPYTPSDLGVPKLPREVPYYGSKCVQIWPKFDPLDSNSFVDAEFMKHSINKRFLKSFMSRQGITQQTQLT